MTVILALKELKPCKILERVTRFTVKVEVEGGHGLALLRNTGRLHDLIYHGAQGLCLPRPPSGKTGWLLAGVKVGGGEAALIDPTLQCRAFEESSRRGLLPWMNGWRIEGREVFIQGSRLDYSLRSLDGRLGFIEVKSAVHFTGHYSMYPDCPSERGRRHISILRSLNRSGYRSIISFIAAHPYAEAFRPDIEADPELAAELAQASREGVEVYSVKMALDEEGSIHLLEPLLPVEMPG